MKILMWGTGKYAEYFLNLSGSLDSIHGFISDSEPSDAFARAFIQDRKIYKSPELVTVEFDIIIVAVLANDFIQAIEKECKKLGLDAKKIVFLRRLLGFNYRFDTVEEETVFNLFSKPFTLPVAFFDFIAHWREYYYLNKKEIPQKLSRLFENLDAESIEVANRLSDRNFKMLPLPEYAEHFLWNLHEIMDDSETKLYTTNKGWEDKARRQYQIPLDLPVEFSVFHYDCGLAFVPEEVRGKLQGKDFIDGGAFWGDSALVLNRYSPSSIHCFEPFEANYNMLVKHKNERQLTHFVPVKMGLGDRDTQNIDYYFDALQAQAGVLSTASCLNHDHSKSNVETTVITVTAIDDYAKANALNVGLIKLDVEGHELATIRGALETIKASRPVLIISIYHTPEDMLEIKPLLESLDLDYKFMIRQLTYIPNTEVMLIAY